MAKVSGISFIKDGISLGYPIVESIESIEPLCDEIVINVGFNDCGCTQDDGTEELLRSRFTGKKYKFLKSYWDPEIRKGGEILSQQTNIALREATGDICQYIQGDEAIHEEDYPAIEAGFKELYDRRDLHGLIFNYRHFYGNVDVYKYTRSVYRREVRAIKNHMNIISWKDAQGFRFSDTRKINAKSIDAWVYHYGWARQEEVMRKKIAKMDALYHDDVEEKNFRYSKLWGIKRFEGTHPAVLANWIEANASDLDILAMSNDYSIRNWAKVIADYFEKLTGHRIGEYKNFKQIR